MLSLVTIYKSCFTSQFTYGTICYSLKNINKLNILHNSILRTIAQVSSRLFHIFLEYELSILSYYELVYLNRIHFYINMFDRVDN